MIDLPRHTQHIVAIQYVLYLREGQNNDQERRSVESAHD